MSNRWHVALLLLGLAFLVWLIGNIGLGEVWRQLTALGWGIVPLLLGEGLAELIHTMGWRRCLSAAHRKLSFFHLFRIRMAGYAINYITPTAALGGEISRAGLLASVAPGPDAACGVLVDKACFAVGHLAIVVAGSIYILWRVPLSPALRLAMMIAIGPLALGIVAFVGLQRYGKLGALVRWMAARPWGGKKLRSAAVQITLLDNTFRDFYRERPGDFGISVCWHLVGFSVGIAQTWLFLTLVRQPPPIAAAATAWILGLWFDLLSFAIPMNVGALEGSRVVAFKTLGYDAAQGATFGLTMRMAQVCWTVFGLASYALLLRQQTIRGPSAETQRAEEGRRKTIHPETNTRGPHAFPAQSRRA